MKEVAASRHEVISGRLLLAGLALLDPVLAASLEVNGVRTRLLAEIDVLPRTPDDGSADVGFATDLVGDGQPYGPPTTCSTSRTTCAPSAGW